MNPGLYNSLERCKVSDNFNNINQKLYIFTWFYTYFNTDEQGYINI